MSEFNPDSTLEFELVRTFSLQRQWYMEMWQRNGYDIEGVEWRTLNYLWFNGPTSQSVFVEMYKRDKAFITRLIKRMIEKGWIYTEQDPEDRRSMIVYLSETGSSMKTELIDLYKQSRKQALKGISEDEQKLLIKLLKHWRNNMI